MEVQGEATTSRISYVKSLCAKSPKKAHVEFLTSIGPGLDYISKDNQECI